MDNIKAKIKENVSLRDYSTFRIGGEARFFLEIDKKEELSHAWLLAKENGWPIRILGGGSNILVNSAGVDGLVIRLKNNFIKFDHENVTVGAGASLGELVAAGQAQGFTGLEWGVGIPGTVGGAIRGNAGAFGMAIGDDIARVMVFDLESGQFVNKDRRDCGFNYRSSQFQSYKNWVIWEAIIYLNRGISSEMQAKIRTFANHRASTQPKYPSAGSIFKNPSLASIQGNNPVLAQEAMESGMIKDDKVPAGWLLERAGLKGHAIGGAQVSEQHANFIVNRNDATSDDIAQLISFAKQQVRDQFHVQLQEEIEYFGF